MELTTIHTKTSKGVMQISKKTAPLSKDLMNVLKLVDGKSTLQQLSDKADLTVIVVEKALATLAKEGFVREFEQPKKDTGFDDDVAGSAGGGDDDDFDFTAPDKAKAIAPRPGAPAAPPPPSAAELAAQAAAREKAQTEARARAEQQAQIRARLEVEARAKAEAERRAVEEAKRMQEAAERAKRDMDAKMAEEAARRKAMAESQVKLTQEQMVKEQEHQKAIAAARAKAETEAKALAEARAKAEAEARALAEARVRAEAAAKKQAAESEQAQKDLRAQLKEEIEARIRKEMESKMREEIEESAREELNQAIIQDAKEEARLELERRLLEESALLQKAEAEAKRKAEEEAKRMLAEQEVRLRAEMETRIKAETEKLQRANLEARARAEREAIERQELEEKLKKEAAARQRAEAEAKLRQEADAKNRMEMEARARAEAEIRAKSDAEMKARLEAEQRGKYEAEARLKIEAEERAKGEMESRIKLDAERKMREQAEEKAKLADNAEMLIDQERKLRAKAEAKAREQEEAEERDRQEQVMRLKRLQEQADERARKETEALESGGASRHQKVRRKGPTPWGRYIVLAILLLAGGGVGALHIIPLNTVQAKMQKALTEFLHDEVSLTGVHFSMFPSPRLRLNGLTVGQALDAKANRGVIEIPITALFADNFRIDTLELDGIAISNEAAARIPTWAKAEGRPENFKINRIVLRNVKIDVKDAPLDAFHADLRFDKGALTSASLQASDGKWSMNARPGEGAWQVDVTLKNFTYPGVPFPIEVSGKGTVSGTEAAFPEVTGSAFVGSFTGSVRANWASGINLNAELSAKDVNLTYLYEAFTKDIQITGRMEGAFSVTAAAPNLTDLMRTPAIQGSFSVRDGSVSNIDLVQAMRSPDTGGRGGATKFAELTGSLQVANKDVQYTKLTLQGGVLHATGDIGIGADDSLRGRLNAELRSTVAQDRGTFILSGSVTRPTARRGG